MNPGSITTSTFQLRDVSNTLVPANVTYNSETNVATLSPQSALQYGMTYTATVKGGSGGCGRLRRKHARLGRQLVVHDRGVAAGDPRRPLDGANRFGVYLGEILRNEGVNAFTTIDVALISPALLSNFDVVVLGETPLTVGQVTMLSNWVNAGGNLIAMRPDGQLAGLLGLTSAGTTLANAYLKVDTTAPPGTGITGETIQFHGTADRYTLNGATPWPRSTRARRRRLRTRPSPCARSAEAAARQRPSPTTSPARSSTRGRGTRRGREGARRRPGIRPGDMFFGQRLDRHEQDRDPAGRRAAAACSSTC